MPTLLPPPASAIHSSLPEVHYLDAYCVPAPAHAEATAVAHALFQQSPAWVSALMRLRNAVARRLGLRSTADHATGGPTPRQPGDWQGPFEIFAATPAEVVLGLNDRHLDFRVSVRMEPGVGMATAWVSTAVQFHNGFGRLYFALIRPFHGLVVRALLRAARARLAALPRHTG